MLNELQPYLCALVGLCGIVPWPLGAVSRHNSNARSSVQSSQRLIWIRHRSKGKVVKIVNQMMAAIYLLTIGEAFALGVKCGADPNTLYEVIKGSSGYSKMMDLRLPGFLFKGSFQPGFKLDLMKNDLNLALESAKAAGVPLDLASEAAQVFAAARWCASCGQRPLDAWPRKDP